MLVGTTFTPVHLGWLGLPVGNVESTVVVGVVEGVKLATVGDKLLASVGLVTLDAVVEETHVVDRRLRVLGVIVELIPRVKVVVAVDVVDVPCSVVDFSSVVDAVSDDIALDDVEDGTEVLVDVASASVDVGEAFDESLVVLLSVCVAVEVVPGTLVKVAEDAEDDVEAGCSLVVAVEPTVCTLVGSNVLVASCVVGISVGTDVVVFGVGVVAVSVAEVAVEVSTSVVFEVVRLDALVVIALDVAEVSVVSDVAASAAVVVAISAVEVTVDV